MVAVSLKGLVSLPQQLGQLNNNFDIATNVDFNTMATKYGIRPIFCRQLIEVFIEFVGESYRFRHIQRLTSNGVQPQ